MPKKTSAQLEEQLQKLGAKRDEIREQMINVRAELDAAVIAERDAAATGDVAIEGVTAEGGAG